MTKKKKVAGPEVPLSSRYTMISSGMGEHLALKPGTEGAGPEPWPPAASYAAGSDIDKVIKKPKIKGEQAAAVIVDEASSISVDKLAKVVAPSPGFMSTGKGGLAALKEQLGIQATQKAFAAAVEAGDGVTVQPYGKYSYDMAPVEDVYVANEEPVTLPYLGSPNPAPIDIGGGIVKGKAFEPGPYPQAKQTFPEPPPRNYLDDIIADRRGVDMLEMP